MAIIDRSGGVVAAGNPTMTDRRTGIFAGIAIKAPVHAATTANITRSGEQTVDGVALVAGNRALVKDQTAPAENGVYVVSTGAWTRATDFDSIDEIASGTLVFVAAGGTLNGVSLWYVSSADPTVIDTSAISFGNVKAALGLPSVSVDEAVVRFDGVLGGFQGSALRIDDTGNLKPAVSDVGALGTTAFQFADLFLAEGGVINWDNGDVTITQTGNILSFAGAATRYEFDAVLTPTASDGAALGTTALMWSDVFLASGAVLNFNAGDVTLTHAANALAFAGASSGYSFDAEVLHQVAGNTGRFVNTTDAASVQAARFEGDRATFADNDEGYLSFLLSDDAGTQTEFARQTFVATDVNVGTSVDGALAWSVAVAGALAGKLRLEGSVLSPFASDGTALGSTGLMWADLFLASAAVINFNAGDVTLTHAANALAFAGAASGYSFDALVTPAADDGAPLGSTGLKWSDLFLAAAAVINFNAGDVTLTHAANALAFAGASSGYSFDALVTPAADDGAPLGSTALKWSDVFLASGAVLNFNNGNVTVTHSAGALALLAAGAAALAVGANGATNPVLQIDASAATVATGVKITGAAAASRAAIAAISSGVNEGLSIDGKGSGTIRLGATSTGAIEFSRNAVPTASDGAALGTTALMWSDLFLASGGVLNFNNGDVTITHSADLLTFAGGNLAFGAFYHDIAEIASPASPAADTLRVFAKDVAGVTHLFSRDSAGTETDHHASAGGGAAAATQAELEAASSTTVYSSPGRQHFHPSAAKAWVQFNNAGTVAASYNITSVTDNGTGDWTVNIATDLSSASFGIAVSVQDASARLIQLGTVTAGTIPISVLDSTFGAVDATAMRVVAFGDL